MDMTEAIEHASTCTKLGVKNLFALNPLILIATSLKMKNYYKRSKVTQVENGKSRFESYTIFFTAYALNTSVLPLRIGSRKRSIAIHLVHTSELALMAEGRFSDL